MIGLEIGATKEGVIVGGVAKSLAQLCKELSKAGHELTLITTSPRGQQKTENHLSWADCYAIHVRGSYPSVQYSLQFTLKTFYLLKRLHKTKHFDIIVGHSGHPLVSIIPALSGKMLGISSVHTLYTPFKPGNFSKSISGSFFLYGLTKINLGLVDLIICFTPNIARSLSAVGISNRKLKVILPGIDLNSFNPSVSGDYFRKQLGTDEYGPIILLVGNLTPQKGTFVALEAMLNVVKQFPKAKLILTSELPSTLSDQLLQTVEDKVQQLGLGDNVLHLGIVPNMEKLMAASDIIIIPFLSVEKPGLISDYPLALLEAMALGKPVVATDVGGIGEIINSDHNGLLIKAGDPIALTRSIITLATDHELANALGRNAFSYISANFSIDKMAEQTALTYADLVRLRRSRQKNNNL